MKRRNFFKTILAALGFAAAPKMTAEVQRSAVNEVFFDFTDHIDGEKYFSVTVVKHAVYEYSHGFPRIRGQVHKIVSGELPPGFTFDREYGTIHGIPWRQS